MVRRLGKLEDDQMCLSCSEPRVPPCSSEAAVVHHCFLKASSIFTKTQDRGRERFLPFVVDTQPKAVWYFTCRVG